jgi:hypothetical protein
VDRPPAEVIAHHPEQGREARVDRDLRPCWRKVEHPADAREGRRDEAAMPREELRLKPIRPSDDLYKTQSFRLLGELLALPYRLVLLPPPVLAGFALAPIGVFPLTFGAFIVFGVFAALLCRVGGFPLAHRGRLFGGFGLLALLRDHKDEARSDRLSRLEVIDLTNRRHRCVVSLRDLAERVTFGHRVQRLARGRAARRSHREESREQRREKARVEAAWPEHRYAYAYARERPT